MMSYITAAESLAQQLEDLNSPTQSQIMTKIVSTLPTKFRHVITVWGNLPETVKTIPQLITKLMNEQHRNSSSTASPDSEIQSTEDWSSSFSQTRKVYDPYRHLDSADRERKCEECEFCGQFYHSESTCTRRINEETGHPDPQCEYCRNYDHSEIDCNKRKSDERNNSQISKASRVNFAKAVNFVNSYDSEDNNGVAFSANSDSMY